MEAHEAKEEPFALLRYLPEVVLIGSLLLLWGLYHILRDITSFKQLLEFFFVQGGPTRLPHQSPIPQHVLSLIIDGVLSLGSIAIGIGLLYFAPWARRAGVIFLCAQFLVAILFQPTYQYIGEQPLLQWFTVRYLSVILNHLHYALMVPFLENARIRQAWEDNSRPGRLTELSEYLFRVLPRQTTPVQLLLIALLLGSGLERLHGGLVEIFAYLPSMLQGSNFPGIHHQQLLPLFIFVVCGYAPLGCVLLVSAIGLFFRTRWAYPLAILAVSCTACLQLLRWITPYLDRLSLPSSNMPPMIGIIPVVLLDLLGYGVTLFFLVKAFSPRQTQWKAAAEVG